MKKIYQTPDIVVCLARQEQPLLSGSIEESDRMVEGDPLNNDMPGTTGNSSEEDGYGNGQQGPGSPSNRAKGWDYGFDTWDVPDWL